MDRASEWLTGEVIIDGFISDGLECSRCGMWYMVRNEVFELKFFVDTHGFLCQRCFFLAGPCSVCGGLAIVKDLCRNCYIDEKEDIATLEELAWGRAESTFMSEADKPKRYCERDQSHDEEAVYGFGSDIVSSGSLGE